MLKDESEKLIHNGYLQDYICDGRAKPLKIMTIFGGPHFVGETRGARDCYLREAKDRLLTNIDSLDKWPTNQFKGDMDDITSSDRNVHHIRHTYCDALVITTMVANNNVYRILVDNGSSIDILYYQAHQRMGLKISDLKPSPNPIYSFIGDSITPMGVISLPMTLEEYPRQSYMMTDFLVIDQPSAFNAVLGRPSLRELRAITSIYHLLIKFHMPNGVEEVKGN